jgi:hypothetical protein
LFKSGLKLKSRRFVFWDEQGAIFKRLDFHYVSAIVSIKPMVKTRSSAKDDKHPSTPPPRSSKKLPPSSSSTGKKQKNRVTATQSPPRLVPLPPVLQSPDQASVSSHSTTSSRSSQGPLTLNIQKQLAQDIEKGGGIESLFTCSEQKVNSLCNAREEVYGRRGHHIRRKIQNKVNRWKTLHLQGNYVEQVLNKFEVKSFLNLRFEERKQENSTEFPKKKEDTVSSSDSDSSDSDSESDRSSTGSISSDNSPLPERLFEKGNFPAVPRSVETRAPRKIIEEKNICTEDFIMPNNIPSRKYLVSYPDGRYLGVVKLDSGFNENREAFRMSECRRKVIHRKKKATDTTPDPMEDANKIFSRHGFDENSIHRVTLQAKIDELMKTLRTDEFTDTTIFEINEEWATRQTELL